MSDVKPKEKTAEPKVLVRFRSASFRIKSGEEREVDQATADQLVADGHATVVK